MSRSQNLFTRDDTFLGICEGVGEDLRINPLWLRLTLALVLFWSPMAALVAYAVMGVAVLASRLLFPKPRATAPAQPVTVPTAASREDDQIALPLAA